MTTEITSLLPFILNSSPFAKAVLIVLVLMSLASWYVIFAKWFTLLRARRNGKAFSEVAVLGGWQKVQEAGKLKLRDAALRSLQYNLFVAGQNATGKHSGNAEQLPTQVRHVMNLELERQLAGFEHSLPFLATTASVAPYIGLLGTVLGVMNAFLGLSSGGNNTLVNVAPGIAESLVATALGLFVAIPALTAYNYFVNQVALMERAARNFIADWSESSH